MLLEPAHAGFPRTSVFAALELHKEGYDVRAFRKASAKSALLSLA